VNGAAAHKADVGDILIIAAFSVYSELELQKYHPTLVYVDEHNRIAEKREKIPVQAAA
jgi:aspartate 1-decarboxylase